MSQFYGSSSMSSLSSSPMILTIEANKENIPPGIEFQNIKHEPIVLPEPNQRSDDATIESPIPSRFSIDGSSLSSQESPATAPVATVDEGDDDQETTSRKEKSLGLLCQRFLIAMNDETKNSTSKEVHLETVARKMSVEKRRIYDIVNVMEALDAMQKTNKSYYKWQGLEDLPKLMFDLQNEAVDEGLPERVLRVEQAMCSFTELSSPAARRVNSKEVVGSLISNSTKPSTSEHRNDVEKSSIGVERRSRVDNRDRQGRNSLAQLCRRFLMVLLSNPKTHRKVSLDVASTVLIKDPETEGFEPPSRSRCRRLYDIANVLVALGLIKKVHYLFGTKKIPLFVYCGPEPDENAEFDVYSSVERLLSSQKNTPSTPTIKATTEKIVQQLAGFGKRSHSDLQIESSNSLFETSSMCRSSHKMAKYRSTITMPAPKKLEIQSNSSHSSPQSSTSSSSCSLMMFAELAAAERLRIDAFAQQLSQLSPLIPSSSAMPKPQPQKPQLYRFLPNNLPTCFYDSSASFRPSTTSTTRDMTLEITPSVKHSMSNILKSNSTSNTKPTPQFDHTTTSPFQVVKKNNETRPKKVFGEIQNLQ